MTPAREQLNTLSKAIDDLNKVGNKAFHDAYDLQGDRVKVYVQIIKDEKLLAGVWTIKSTEHVLELEAVEDWESFPGVRELLKPDYHESYDFWGYATYLRFNDGVVTLSLQHEDALQFIRDHGIVVDLCNLTKERDDLVIRLDAANALLADMKELTT